MAVQQGLVDWKGNPINKHKHGGIKASTCLHLMVAMTNMAFVPNIMNMVHYLHQVIHMNLAASSTTVTNFLGATCAFALFGGILSDSYITRFKAILFFVPLEFLGFGLLALQAHLPSLRPSECDISGPWSDCEPIRGFNAALLYISMYITALGEGCLRANLPSFGGDQFDEDDSTESRLKSSFFNWFAFSISLGSFAGLIFTVWIENNVGWDIGFALSASLVLLGLLVLASGFSLYRNQTPCGSPLTRMFQVLVAAFRNRKLNLAENKEELVLDHDKEQIGEEVLPHTEGLQCLDKASISSGRTGKWYRCTVTQVEETKIVLRMLPIFLCAIIGYIPIPQLMTFTVQQGSTMDTKLGKINFSPATLLIIPLVFEMVILVAYDRLFVPIARRITGYQTGITHLQRVGVGFLSASLAPCVAALIERERKHIAEECGLTDSSDPVPMSVTWLGLQFLFVGITDSFTFVGLLEFFNSEASRGMKSLGSALFWCNLGLGSFIGSFLVDAVNRATRSGGGGIGWLDGNNLNKNHLDLFYLLLSILGFLGFMNYLYWAKRYQYRQHSLTTGQEFLYPES